MWALALAALLFAVLLSACGGGEDAAGGGDGAVAFVTADTKGDLYAIDPTTGSTERVLDVWATSRSGPVDIGPVGGLAVDPANARVVAVTTDAAGCGGTVYGVDVATGEGTILDVSSGCGLGPMSTVGDIARRASDGLIAALEPFDGHASFSIDPTTGVASSLGGLINNVSCWNGLGLAFAANGTAYFAGDDGGGKTYLCVLVVGNPPASATHGEITFTGMPGTLSAPVIVAMATHPNGMIYGLLNDGAVASYLVTITPTSGAAEAAWVATLTGSNYDGLIIPAASLIVPPAQ